MKYKSVMVTRRGGPENLQVVEHELRPPAAGEARIKVLAAPVSGPDVTNRYGRSPFPIKTPFTPGYAVIGVVDALGPAKGSASSTAAVGDRVAAFTAYGGYTEYLYWRQDWLIPVPTTIDPAEAATLLLNYLVAYQVMYRVVKARPGQAALIIGASGGIGTALLQLGRLAKLRMYGLASASKHAILREYGATPVDYRSQDFVEVIRQAEPDGLDAVFDGMGGDYLPRGFPLLRKGGVWAGFANPGSYSGMFKLVGRVLLLNLLPDGRSAKLYGTGLYRLTPRPFLEDWATLFKMLEDCQIKPVIAGKYPILEAAQANAELESGQVVGNLVLIAPELL